MLSNKFTIPSTLLAWLKQLSAAALYVLFGTIVHRYFTDLGLVSIFWPSSGLALSVVLIGGRRYIFGIMCGALLLNLLSNYSLWAIFGITLANVLEVQLGIWLLMRNNQFSTSLNKLTDYLWLITLGGGIPSIVAAMIGALSLLLADYITSVDYINSAIHWWMGDTLGIVLITPLALAWWQKKSTQLTRKQWIEALLLVGITFIAGQIIFFGWFKEMLIVQPKGFIMFLFITWIAIRLGIKATTFALNMIALQALLGTYRSIGYFSSDAHLHNYWLYILILSGVGMALTIYVNELKQKELSLQKSESHLRLSHISGGIGTWEADLVNHTQVWSDSCLALIGFPTSSEPSWDDFLAVVYPEDRQKLIGMTLSHIKYNSKYDVEYRVITASKGIRWMHSVGQAERDAHGKPILMRGILHDVTDSRLAEDKLHEQERLLADSQAIAHIGSWMIDINTFKITWSDETFRLYGLSPITDQPPTWEQFLALLHPNDQPRMQDWVTNCLSGKPISNLEFRTCLINGVSRWLLSYGNLEYKANGEPLRMIGTVQDITERKQADEELRIAATAFEAQEGMIITDADNIILRVNCAFTTITGYSHDEVVGKNPRLLQSGRHDIQFYQTMWEHIHSTGSWEGELWNRRKNGEIYPQHLTITAVKGADNTISNYVSTLIDISTRKAAEIEIERLAFYDPLTALPNRRLLFNQLKQALIASARNGLDGALLFIDLDNFKNLNDTLGHNMGDLLLQQAAKRLTDCVREDDTVARLGGDEFIIILENLSKYDINAASQVEMISEKILATLNQPYQLNDIDYHSTASIGVTLFNNNQQSIEDLFKQADIAMYQSKAAGRNVVRFFNPEMQACITARVLLEADLRLALADHQFTLYYQLQTTHHNQIIGAEVLIRWQHPQRGLVAPNDFITLAEETGLILPIGQWILETACAQIKRWESSSDTQHLQLAVNVSARQFQQADFVEQVCDILRRSAIRPELLKLELTESLILDDINDAIEKMNSLRKRGVRFSMDDFGTGYSSLSYLTQLPLDQLKIDQSFISNIGVKPTDAMIVQTIIGMANNLDIEVIAEGVETEAQRAFLEQHGCLLCQGYLFSRPLPIEQFTLLLTHK